ncbi:MAG: metallophosphoesterase, partial [Anaerolineales bacterium]
RTILEEIPLYAELLGKIEGPKGKFAVVGNHDHWRVVDTARYLIAAGGFEDLTNRNVEMKIDQDSIRICGLDSYMEDLQDLKKAMADLHEGDVVILLVHEPDFADVSGATGRFALQLSGHSHGGQIYVPLLGPPVTPDFGRKYPRGRYQVEEMHLYTTPGIGMIPPYVRLNCRPEITMITLESDKGQN